MNDYIENHRNVTLSFKTTAEEKTALQQVANEKQISRSELIASLVNAYKYSYDYIGKTSPKEAELESQLIEVKRENRKLTLALENAENRIELEQKANQGYIKEQLEMNKIIFDLREKLNTANKNITSLNEQLKSIPIVETNDSNSGLLIGSIGSLLISGLALFFAPRLFNR